MEKEKIVEAAKKVLEDKGKKKFLQTIELAINFKGIDFNKAENKLNMDVVLPKGRGKEIKIVVFADETAAAEAKTAGADLIISGDGIAKFATDEGKVKKMAKDWEFVAEPKLMVQVGKHMGQILGARGKLPRPAVGNIAILIKNLRNTLRIKTKGKNLPTINCPVGTEKMSAEDIAENVLAILNAIKTKVDEQFLYSCYLKLTMGSPVKV